VCVCVSGEGDCMGLALLECRVLCAHWQGCTHMCLYVKQHTLLHPINKSLSMTLCIG
jgi:hypothetical protein